MSEKSSARGQGRPNDWSRMGSRPPAQDNTTCLTCEKPFHLKPSALARGKGKYCSRVCYTQAPKPSGAEHPRYGRTRSVGFEIICAGCGVTFRNRRSRVRYCSAACHHRTNPPKPKVGHRGITTQGYARLTLPDGTRVLEHRWVYEQTHGIKLTPKQLVHHTNELKTDNRPENLRLMESLTEHNAEHGGTLRSHYPKRTSECHPEVQHGARGLCVNCYQKQRRGTL